jgi:predicted ferric reductase
VTSSPIAAPVARRLPEPPARRKPPRARPVVVDLLAAATGLGLGITVALGLSAQSLASVSTLPGFLTATGRMTGLLSAYAMMITVALSARIGPLERAIGQDRLIAWHRRLGPWGLYLLLAHVALIVLGYAGEAQTGVLAQLWDLIVTYPGMLAAAVGVILLFVAGITSYNRARRRMRYETWWTVHLYTYLALLFAFSHQVDNGASFVNHSIERVWWTALWVGLLALVVGYRIGLPILRSVRHRIRVVEVVRESPGIVSIVLSGRDLDRLPVAGGQFFQWRFLQPGLWWQAHPYSLSHVPHRGRMRITVKDLGDHSRGIADLAAGTPVFVEGPYGRFTPDAGRHPSVLLIGAGVGMTPILALLQDLEEQTDVVVLARASSEHDLVHREEVAAEVGRRGGRLFEVVGPRQRVRLTAPALLQAVPDLRDREIYVCGPDAFTESLLAECRAAGVPQSQLHAESFVF